MPPKPTFFSSFCKGCHRTIVLPGWRARQKGRGTFCSRSCYASFRFLNRADVAERFWSFVHKTPDCWIWKGAVGPNGYGAFGITRCIGKVAHRVAWELIHGPIPSGMLVCHRCDVRACVRPEHLFLGTYADNSRDMVLKGRHAPMCRLTEDDVIAIRNARQGETHEALAKRYGVGRATIQRILYRKTWKHL